MPMYLKSSVILKRNVLLNALTDEWETCQEIFARVGDPFRSDDDVYNNARVLYKLKQAEKDKSQKRVRFRKAAKIDNEPI